MHFDQTLLDAAPEVGVDETQRDAKFRSQPALRHRTIPLDRFQKAENNLDVLVVLLLSGAGYAEPLLHPFFYGVHTMNVKPTVHAVNKAMILK
jgi:hypothetical protein